MKQYTVKATKMAYAGNCNSIEELVEMPERYSLVDEEPWRTEGMKKIIVKNFLIYFWIVRTPDGLAELFGRCFPAEFRLNEANPWMALTNETSQYLSVLHTGEDKAKLPSEAVVMFDQAL